MKRALGPLVAILCLAVGAYAYLYPGSHLLFSGSTTAVMSDDTDPAPLPFAYDALIRTFNADPSHVLYGAVPLDVGNPDHPAAAWLPFSERAIVLSLHRLVPLEQLSTAVVFVLLVLTGLSFYALARAWGFRESIALGLAMAWAFCPFERARAKVHMAMVGTYHLPLIFLGLWLIATKRSRRSVAAAALCFALAVTTIHYFIITAAALVPLYLAYVVVERRSSLARVLARLIVAALPATLWLGWSLTHPLPASVDLKGETALPRTGEMPSGVHHPFLWTYAARPLDYLGGDLALTGEDHEWFRPRAWINERTIADLGYGNAHERTNGIRYLILTLALIGFITARGRARRTALVFGAFALASFWLSLNPDWPAAGFGISGWLQTFVSQVRVPSRAGIGVHFALLCVAGFTLTRAPRALKWLSWPAVLPMLVVLEYPPVFSPMPIVAVRPAYAELNANGACGLGLLFPVVSDDVFPGIYYHFKQRLRGTGCTFVNAITRPDVARALQTQFPTSVESVRTLEQNLVVVDRVTDLVRCARLNWIAFDPVTPARVREEICTRLGWRASADLTCVADAAARQLASTTEGPDRACL